MKSAPVPAHRNGGHPDPLPASVLLHLFSRCPQGCLEIGCRRMGEGGGSGGRGVDSSARPSATPGRKPWALLSQKSSLNPTISPSSPGCAHRPPSYPRGGGAPGGEGGMVGLRDDSTPQASDPTPSTPRLSLLHCLNLRF